MTGTNVGKSNSNISGEPLVGAELISIAMQLYQIEFDFSKCRLCISGDFSLSTASGRIERYDPSKHQGSAQALWPLVGHVVAHTSWNHPIEETLDSIEIVFDNGTKIWIPPRDRAGSRGTLWDKSAPRGVLYVDDFRSPGSGLSPGVVFRPSQAGSVDRRANANRQARDR